MRELFGDRAERRVIAEVLQPKAVAEHPHHRQTAEYVQRV
jgi:hypothetical protein